MTSPRPKGYKSYDLQVTRIRKAAALARKKCESRMTKKGLRNDPPAVYNIGKKVLIRYLTAKKLCSKRCVLQARVLQKICALANTKLNLHIRPTLQTPLKNGFLPVLAANSNTERNTSRPSQIKGRNSQTCSPRFIFQLAMTHPKTETVSFLHYTMNS